MGAGRVLIHSLSQIFIPILHGLALAVKECSFDSDNFKFPLMVSKWPVFCFNNRKELGIVTLE